MVKPEDESRKVQEELMHKALPSMIKPVSHSFIDAAHISQIALEAVSVKLPKNDPVRTALQDASNPKNIEKVSVNKGTTPETIYSVEITLKGKPVILTIGIGDKAMVVSLADRQGNAIEDVRQEGSQIVINRNTQARLS
jgi:hypothetical protein